MSTIDNIIKLLDQQHKKQKDLTDYLGISKNRFTDWKSGRIQSYKKYLPEIAEFFGVSIDYLLGRQASLSEGGGPLAVEGVNPIDRSDESLLPNGRMWASAPTFYPLSPVGDDAHIVPKSVDEKVSLTPKEQTLVTDYRSLDDKGKDKASDYVSDLVKLHGLHLQQAEGGYDVVTRPHDLSAETLAEIEKILEDNKE